MNSSLFTKRTFDHQAASYDNDIIVRLFQRPIQKLVLNMCDIKPGMRVLDVGCGTGKGLIDIAQGVGANGYVVGCDISEKMIAVSQKTINELELDNVFVTQGEIFDIHKEKFDLIVTTNTFHHVQDKQARIKHAYALLLPGGKLVIEEFCNDYRPTWCMDQIFKIYERGHIGSLTSKKLSTMMLATGFQNVQVQKRLIHHILGIMIVSGGKP